MTPLALRMLSLASSTMWSGVSLGKLIMTDLWGAAAMVVAANRAVRTDRVAKRISRDSIECCEERVGGVFIRSLFGGVLFCGLVDCSGRWELGTIWGARKQQASGVRHWRHLRSTPLVNAPITANPSNHHRARHSAHLVCVPRRSEAGDRNRSLEPHNHR